MGGLPVTLVNNGAPVTQAVGGIAVTVVDINGVPVGVLPVGDAAVGDGDPVVLTGTDGTRGFGNVTAKVTAGNLASVRLPSGSTVITSQVVGVQDADGTSVDCSPVIQPQTGQLNYISVPGTAALVTSGMTVKMAGYGGSSPVDGLASITGGFVNYISLASQANAIVANGFTVNLGAVTVSGVQDYTTINVASGGITSVGVALAPTKAIVVDAAAAQIKNSGGTVTATGTFSVAAGVASAKLPASNAIVPHGVAMQVPLTGTYTNTITPQVNASGVITSFVAS